MTAALPGVVPAFAQIAAPAHGLTSGRAYVSASGALAYGFSPTQVVASPFAAGDLTAMLANGSSIPGPMRPIVEQMYRASPTFRRQWAQLAAASVLLHITLDHERIPDGSLARSVIRRKRHLRIHIHLRGADPHAPRHLAHEIEHALEQLDDVDLEYAAAHRLHGVSQRSHSHTFETRRAIAIGRQVAAEVSLAHAGS
jgi:hypothetical protein